MIRGNTLVSIDVTTHYDLGKMLSKSKSAKAKLQLIYSDQVLKDSNKYAPLRDGFLIASGFTHSNLTTGMLKWQTPYARRLYYNPQYNFSTDKNPLAGGLWFERAKKQHKGDWEGLVKRGYKRFF